MYNYLAQTAVRFFLTNQFSRVVVTSGDGDLLSLLWDAIVFEVSKNREVTIGGDNIYFGDNEWAWGIIRVPYIKGKPERFAGCMTKRSMMIVYNADLVEDAVIEVGRTFTVLVVVNGSDI